MSTTPNPSDRVSFLSEQPFIEQNREPIEAVFDSLAADFPDHTVIVDGESVTTSQALKIDDAGELTFAARRWLWEKAQGAQHGYDRGVGGKVYIEHQNRKYMRLLGNIAYGPYNLIEGGNTPEPIDDKNILVGAGFPHLASGRIDAVLQGEYSKLWVANSTAVLSGQRRRWTDNDNESTATRVIERTVSAMGLNTEDERVKAWERLSPFARKQVELGEGPAWHNAYATEAEMGRAALELALLRADGLFNFSDYKVEVHEDSNAEELLYDGGVIPPRTIRAWEYKLENGKSAWVTNAAAIRRVAPDGSIPEPRPNGAATIKDGYDLLKSSWQTNESIIATGAPHIRLGMDMATTILDINNKDLSTARVAKLHLNVATFEDHEPPITAVAQIVSTDKADKRLRAAENGQNPDTPELSAL